jgi:hypothetical protein
VAVCSRGSCGAERDQGYGQERGKDAQFGVRNARNYVAENERQKTKKACRLGKPLMLFRRFEPL